MRKGAVQVITINYRDGRPIYQQVKDSLRRLILTGGLSEHKLPSVRSLASELAINPNTIQRAYRELEAEGYIYSVPGKGSFAVSDPAPDDAARAELLRRLDGIVEELELLGVGREQLAERIKGGERND